MRATNFYLHLKSCSMNMLYPIQNSYGHLGPQSPWSNSPVIHIPLVENSGLMKIAFFYIWKCQSLGMWNDLPKVTDAQTHMHNQWQRGTQSLCLKIFFSGQRLNEHRLDWSWAMENLVIFQCISGKRGSREEEDEGMYVIRQQSSRCGPRSQDPFRRIYKVKTIFIAMLGHHFLSSFSLCHMCTVIFQKLLDA